MASAEAIVFGRLALKPAEDNPKQLILRCYECHAETAELSLQSDLGLTLDRAVDLLEHHLTNQLVPSTIQPWKIATVQ